MPNPDRLQEACQFSKVVDEAQTGVALPQSLPNCVGPAIRAVAHSLRRCRCSTASDKPNELAANPLGAGERQKQPQHEGGIPDGLGCGGRDDSHLAVREEAIEFRHLLG